MELTIRWGNNLEALADKLFDEIDRQKTEDTEKVFSQRDCIVVPNRIQEAWLQHHFLYTRERKTLPHVLANCDFKLMTPFVTEWLGRMDSNENAKHSHPEEHPFSVKSMRWKIYDFLQTDALEDDFVPLKRTVAGKDGKSPDPRKCFKLASRLAKLMDEYVTYRPGMMRDWKEGKDTEISKSTAWEPALWRWLIAKQGGESYLDAFMRMDEDLKNCGIEKEYRQVYVFAPSMLPGVYLHFFRVLGKFMPVDFSIFNPSSTDWFDRKTLKSLIKDTKSLDRPEDSDALMDLQHPLLSAYARGSRDLVAAALDLKGGQVDDVFSEPPENTVLEQLQYTILKCDAAKGSAPKGKDGSIQIHLCHGKMREVEILRDQLLDCFNDTPLLQPRQIQVQVADMSAYAPYIDAVFATQNLMGKNTIPYVIADRMVAGESLAAEAFRQLLALADSRFTAPEILNLLRCDSVSRRFGFEAGDMDSVAAWLQQAGVRWGRDTRHRKDILKLKTKFAEETSWRYGLDRLLLGYAMGEETALGEATDLMPRDCVEGDGAIKLGYLSHFYEKLEEFADYAKESHRLANWISRLEQLVDDFFVNDNETFQEVGVLKSAIRLLRTSSEAAGYEGSVPTAVIRDFLSGQLSEAEGGGHLNRNAVVFSSLRPGSSAPRDVMCLLGMGDTLFPRKENRTAYDLLRNTRRMGDRSAPIEDRMAFLEAVMNAHKRLLISYQARSEEDNSKSCESVVVRELTEYLDEKFGEKSYSRTEHRLQAFHPAYFGGDPEHSDLFSFSKSNWSAAMELAKTRDTNPEENAVPVIEPVQSVRLEDIIRFFKNPAQFFYRERLGVRLEPESSRALADTESFDPGHLDQYQVRSRLLDSILYEENPENLHLLHKEMMANGQIPLGEWGNKWFESASASVVAILETTIEGIGPLGTILKASITNELQEEAVSVEVDGKKIKITGSIPFLNDSGEEGTLPNLVSFRCSAPKAHPRLAAWITHLFALSAKSNTVSTMVVQGKDSSKLDQFEAYLFGPLTTGEEAAAPDPKALLADYLRVYLQGMERIPPYTPETALAFVGEIQKGEAKSAKNEKAPSEDSEASEREKGNMDDALIKKAIAAAHKKWESQYNSPAYEGDRNPYFLQAFGKAGPCKDEEVFENIARLIMEPMFSQQKKLNVSTEGKS